MQDGNTICPHQQWKCFTNIRRFITLCKVPLKLKIGKKIKISIKMLWWCFVLHINDIAIMFCLIYSEDSDFEWWRRNQVNIDEPSRLQIITVSEPVSSPLERIIANCNLHFLLFWKMLQKNLLWETKYFTLAMFLHYGTLNRLDGWHLSKFI